MRKLISLLLLLALPFLGQGATVVSSPAAAATNSVLTTGLSITSITVANTSGGAVSIRFIDAPSTSLTFSLGAYTNVTTANTPVTNSYTGFTGITVTTTNTQLVSTTNSVASSTPNFRSAFFMVAPDAQTTTFTPPAGTMILPQGLLITNSAAATITINYQPLLQ